MSPRDRKQPKQPIIIDMDDDRYRTTSQQKAKQNRRRETLRPTSERYDHAEYDGTAIVVALDPGGTTGWSIFEVHPEGLSSLEEHRGKGVLTNVLGWRHGQIDCGNQRGNGGAGKVSTSGEAAGIAEILGLIRAWPFCAVVIEDFILDPKRFNTGRDLLSPVRLTAGIDYDLWLQKKSSFKQSAAMAKTNATDEKLRRWGLYSSTGGLQHARDADRHAVTFLQRASALTVKGRQLRMAAWPHLFGSGTEFYDVGRAS